MGRILRYWYGIPYRIRQLFVHHYFPGLGFGVLGGLTSVITEPLEGAYNDGLAGFFTG